MSEEVLSDLQEQLAQGFEMNLLQSISPTFPWLRTVQKILRTLLHNLPTHQILAEHLPQELRSAEHSLLGRGTSLLI